MAGPLNNTGIDIDVSLNFTRALSQDAPRAAAQLEKLFNNSSKLKSVVEPLGRISTSANEFTRSLEAANARVIAFGASVGVIYNIQRAFEKLVKSTIDVEKALTDIGAITNQTNKELSTFSSELFKIGNQTGQTFSNVSKAALEFSRQGLTAAETLKRVKDALILSRIASIDSADAVETLTAAVNSYSDELLTTTQLINKFVAVDTRFAVSSKDLSEAISRVGSTAVDAGVKLDDLLGVVTAVQQTTARGGAVIGNAFKTIFTRLQRSDTIEQLRELGVEINNSQNGIQKLQALADAVKTADTATSAQIKELAAGVFQINILSAALDDLSRKQGVYASASQVSSNATDEAIVKNERLNKTLATLLVQTENNITQTFSRIGKLSIDSPLRSILTVFNDSLGKVNQNVGDDLGSNLANGVLTGFAKFLEGPGVLIISNILFRLGAQFVQFSKVAFEQLKSINEKNQERAVTERAIQNILQTEPKYLAAILSGEQNIAAVQKGILVDLRTRLAYQERLAAVSASIVPAIGAAGLSFNRDTGSIKRGSKLAYNGYVPPKAAAMEQMGAYAGGYAPGKVKSTVLPGLGKVIYNGAESVVQIPGMSQPAIIPPKNSKAGQKYSQSFKQTHGFSPYNNGLVPNFARFVDYDTDLGGASAILEGKRAEILGISSNMQGTGQSAAIYNNLFKQFSKAGIKVVTGKLLPQNLTPKDNSIQSLIKAQIPQITRGRFGKKSILGVGNREFTFNSKTFDSDLQKYGNDILSELMAGGEPPFLATYLNKGLIPNFSPIASAIQRESKSVPKTLIRVGQSPRLKSPFNPGGLGVYNLRDEPNGLNQGINRAFNEGLNPKSYGIPNFAEFKLESKSIGGRVLERGLLPELNTLLKQIQTNNVSFDKLKPQVDKLIKEFDLTTKSASSVRGIFRSAEIKRPGTLPSAVDVGTQIANKNLIRQGIAGFNKFQQLQLPATSGYQNFLFGNSAIQANAQIKQQINNQKISQGLQTPRDTGSINDFGNLTSFYRQNEINDFIGASNDKRAKFYNVSKQDFDKAAKEYLSSSFKPKDTYEDLMGPAFDRNLEKFQNRVDQIKQKISTTSSFNIGGLIGQGKLLKELEKIRVNSPNAISQSEIAQLRDLRSGKLQNAAAIGSFALPIATQTIASALPNTEAGRRAGVVTGAVGEAGSLALAGYSLGGPVGAAAGAIGGLLTAVPKAIDEFTSKIPLLTKELEKVQSQSNKTAESLNSYITTSEKLSQVYSGELKNITNKQIEALKQEQSRSLLLAPVGERAGLTSAIESGDFVKAREIENRINQNNAQRQNVLTSRVNINQLRRSTSERALDFNSRFNPIFNYGRAISNYGQGVVQSIREGNYNPLSVSLAGGVQAFNGQGVDTSKLLQQRQIGQRIFNAGAPLLTSLQNTSGQNIFELLKQNPDVLNRISNTSGQEKLNLLSNFAEQKGLEDFRDIVKDITDTAKSNGPQALKAVNDYFGKLFSPDEINKASKSLEKFVAKQQEQRKVNLDLENSFIKIISSLNRFQSNLETTFDLQSIRRSGVLERNQLQRENQVRISSLTAGPLEEASLRQRANLQDIRANSENDLININREFIKNSSESIINTYQNLLKGFTDDIISNQNLGAEKKQTLISKRTEGLNKVFQSAGFNPEEITGLLSDMYSGKATGFSPLDAEKINSIKNRLQKADINQSGLDISQKADVEKQLNVLIIRLNELSDSYANAALKVREKTNEAEKTEQQRINNLIEFIGAERKNAILQNNIVSENERRLLSLRLDNERTNTVFKQQTELGGLGLNTINRTTFENSRNIDLIQRQGGQELQEKVLERISKLRQGRNSNISNLLGGVNSQQDLARFIENNKNAPEFALDLKDAVNDAIVAYNEIDNISKEINLKTEKQVETQKEINKFLQEQARLKVAFSDDKAADNLSSVVERLRKGGSLTGSDVTSTIRNELEYNNATLQRDAIMGVSDVTRTMKQSFSEATASIIKDGKDIGEALKDALINVLNRIVDRTTEIGINSLFSGLSSAAGALTRNTGGIISRYSTGGQVKGGSGTKDDVPALLTQGEYVINKQTAQLIGKKKLDEINYGDANKALIQLRNEFAYNNEQRPTVGKFDTNANLSNFALSDTDIIRSNELKFQREMAFYDYQEGFRQYERDKRNALSAFEAQKRNRRYGAYISAATSLAGAGLNSYASSVSNTGVKGGVDFNGFQNNGVNYVNSGGIIRKYANGGRVFGGNMSTDTIPALLTGGEYVIKKDRVDKIGIENLNRINFGKNRFQNGGLVGGQNTNSQFNSDVFGQLMTSINKLNETIGNFSAGTSNVTSSGDVNNYITVSINVDAKGQVNSSSKSNNNTENKNQDNDKRKETSEKFAKDLESKIVSVIINETKQGGVIKTFVDANK